MSLNSTVSFSMSSVSSMGDLGAAHFGVAHGRRRIAVDRAEIALPVDQRRAHGKVLRHAHKRVVDRLVAMRMVFADDVADDARGFAIGLVPVVAVLVHRKENAAMHRLQTVAHIGQRALHDHAHRVVEIGALQLVFDRDAADIIAARRTGRPALCGSLKNRSLNGANPGA